MNLPKTPTPHPLRARLGGLALVAATSAALGWAARGEAPPPAVAAAPCPLPTAPAAPLPAPAPVIAVAGDGRVTLHVDQQPLTWVLEQIAAQANWPNLVAEWPGAAARPVAASAAAAPPGLRPDERVDGLALARRAGTPLDDATLQALVENDPADAVRIAALDALLERHAARADLRQQALQAALLQPSPALRQAAAERLQALGERERIAALPAEPDP